MRKAVVDWLLGRSRFNLISNFNGQAKQRLGSHQAPLPPTEGMKGLGSIRFSQWYLIVKAKDWSHYIAELPT